MAKKRSDGQHAPHDRLFKGIFSRPEHAAAHFETFLPPALVAALELSAAQLVPGTFVDDSLPDRRTDLLYRIPRRNSASGTSSGAETADVLLHVVFEHQSTVDKLMAFRMYRYVVRIWERWLAEHPDATVLPPVLPFVLYHGQRRWNAAQELRELVDLSGLEETAVDRLRPHLPALQLMLNDLGEIPDAALPRHAAVRLTLLLFKHGRGPGLLELLAASRTELQALAAAGEPGLRAFGFLLQYMLTVNAQVDEEALGKTLAALGPEVGEIAMTAYERLIDRGRQEGLQKGLQQGLQQGLQEGRQEGRREEKAAVARRLLAKGMPVDEVAEVVELSVDDVRQLRQ